MTEELAANAIDERLTVLDDELLAELFARLLVELFVELFAELFAELVTTLEAADVRPEGAALLNIVLLLPIVFAELIAAAELRGTVELTTGVALATDATPAARLDAGSGRALELTTAALDPISSLSAFVVMLEAASAAEETSTLELALAGGVSLVDTGVLPLLPPPPHAPKVEAKKVTRSILAKSDNCIRRPASCFL